MKLQSAVLLVRPKKGVPEDPSVLFGQPPVEPIICNEVSPATGSVSWGRNTRGCFSITHRSGGGWRRSRAASACSRLLLHGKPFGGGGRWRRRACDEPRSLQALHAVGARELELNGFASERADFITAMFLSGCRS